MRYRRFLALALVAVVAGACSTGASSTTPASPAAASANVPGSATRLEIKLTDVLRMEPAAVKVPIGQPVTFVVTNSGSNNHEFFVGDEAAQTAHETEMSSMGGMGQDEASGIALKAGETKELTITFNAPGMVIAGCHEPGHYGGGMKAMIEVGS